MNIILHCFSWDIYFMCWTFSQFRLGSLCSGQWRFLLIQPIFVKEKLNYFCENISNVLFLFLVITAKLVYFPFNIINGIFFSNQPVHFYYIIVLKNNNFNTFHVIKSFYIKTFFIHLSAVSSYNITENKRFIYFQGYIIKVIYN